jgi:LysR family carnitine catabolism transcriptional activator
VIHQFLAVHPNLNFSIHDIPNETIIEKVQDGIFELGICFEPDLTEGLEFKPLFEEDFLALLPKVTHSLNHLLLHGMSFVQIHL